LGYPIDRQVPLVVQRLVIRVCREVLALVLERRHHLHIAP